MGLSGGMQLCFVRTVQRAIREVATYIFGRHQTKAPAPRPFRQLAFRRKVAEVLIRLGWAALLLAATVGQSWAANPIPDFFKEPGVNPTRSHAADTTGTEFIDPISGILRLSYQDLVIPGNGGLDIVIQRTYHTNPRVQGVVGLSLTANQQFQAGLGWDIHFGRMLVADSGITPEASCVVNNLHSQNNPVLQLPDGTRKVFFRPLDTLPQREPAYDWITKDRWVARCENFKYQSGGGIGQSTYNTVGFVVNAPDGTEYTFSWDDFQNGYYIWHPTQIRENIGTSVVFSYSLYFPKLRPNLLPSLDSN